MTGGSKMTFTDVWCEDEGRQGKEHFKTGARLWNMYFPDDEPQHGVYSWFDLTTLPFVGNGTEESGQRVMILHPATQFEANAYAMCLACGGTMRIERGDLSKVQA